MKKRNIGTLLQILSAISGAAFLISASADYFVYNEYVTSAPFWVSVLVTHSRLKPGPTAYQNS